MERKIKVLLLEDSPEDAEIVQRLLKKEMAIVDCRHALNRDAYFEALQQDTPDIILADNSVTGFSALQALVQTRERLPHVPFIMITGTVSEEYAVGMIKSGADDYILKDRLQRLSSAIEAALGKRRAEKEADEALQKLTENEEKYRTLIERVSDGFIALDDQWRFVYVNKKAEQLFERPPGTLTGKKIWDEFPESVGEPFYHAYVTAMETQQNAYLKAYSVAIDRWIVSYIYPSPTGLSVYFGDITEQRKAENKIRESEEKYRVLVERITDAFIALDKDFNYIYLNSKAAELARREPASLLGKNVWEIFPEAIESATYESFMRAMKEQVYICSTDYYEPLNLWQENHIYPSPEGLSIFIRDISAVKKSEETMKSMEKEIMHQQIQEQKKISRAIIHAQEKERNRIGQELHDNVNQILVATKMFLTSAAKTEAAKEAIRYPVELIDNSIDEIRSLSSGQVTPLKDIPLREMIRIQLDKIKESTGTSSELLFAVNDEIMHDDLKLNIYRIVQEQLNNIVKYAAAKHVAVSIKTEQNSIRLMISDDGKGFDTKQKRKGIGIANMMNRVEAFNGKMTLDSEPGKGCRLQILIPC
jgi:PAS domain S-box-containing protein